MSRMQLYNFVGYEPLWRDGIMFDMKISQVLINNHFEYIVEM